MPAATDRRTAAWSPAPNACAVGMAKPVRHAPREAEQEEQQRAGGADGGERVDAEDAADDDGVGRLVELLDDVADEQGDGEQDDDTPGTTGGEDLGHSETLGLESGWDVRGGRWCRVASCLDRIDTIRASAKPFSAV